MKTQTCILIATILIAFSLASKAQQVIASSGNCFGGNDVSLSWTLGETVSGTLENNEIILTQGFQQPYNFYLTQILNIPAGWSGISAFVEPPDKGLEGIFGPYIPDFVFLASMSGFYFPQEDINTLGDWNCFTGYKIKANDDFSLSIKGSKVPQPAILLEEGWNLIPVLSSCGVTTWDFNGGLESLVMIKEVGGINVYWPAFGIETLLMLEPGKAYFVRVDESESYTFPECSKNAISAPSNPVLVNNTPWSYPVLTAGSHVISFPSPVLMASDLKPGDYIGAFTPSGICAGITEIAGFSSGTALVAFANDECTINIDGFYPGELFHFKVYRPSANAEMKMDVNYDASMPCMGMYQNQGLSAAKSIALNPSSTPEMLTVKSEVYPNPSNGQFTLAMSSWPDDLRVHLINTNGQVIKDFGSVKNPQRSAFRFDAQEIPPGIYILKLVYNATTDNKKIIIH